MWNTFGSSQPPGQEKPRGFVFGATKDGIGTQKPGAADQPRGFNPFAQELLPDRPVFILDMQSIPNQFVDQISFQNKFVFGFGNTPAFPDHFLP